MELDIVPDNMIKEYLIIWAERKINLFQKILKGKTRVDTAFSYKNMEDKVEDFQQVAKDFPAFGPWISYFYGSRKIKINMDNMSWDFKRNVEEFLPGTRLEGTKITRFFKEKLKAPDDLVTDIAHIYENDTIDATYTVSIDPVDMMLASENPYNWTSCYSLNVSGEDSHADGCLAAILDNSSLITYVWNREGEFSLHNEYTFKKIRYKKMREWISINPEFTAVYFNDIYPGKSYDVTFEKQLRQIVENLFPRINEKEENIWRKCTRGQCCRDFNYGYEEFNRDNLWEIADADDLWKESNTDTPYWSVYNEPIPCPCGCGNILPGSDEEDDGDGEMRYIGGGFFCENFECKYYCEYADDYCTCQCGSYECEGCWAWQDNHPVCSLDDTEECEEGVDVYDGTAHACEHCCSECPLWRKHHPEEEEES